MKVFNMKIGLRLGLGFGIILLILCVAVFVTTLLLRVVDTNSHKVASESFPHALSAADMAFNVVQVQQWLTDVSVTHDVAGYQDAEEAANGFRKGIAAFKQLYARKNDTRSLKKIEELETFFEQYYEDGKIMTNTYITQGREAGNRLMEDFDEVAEALTSDTAEFKKGQIGEAETMMKTIVSAVDNVLKVLLSLTGFAIVLGFLIAFFITRSITRPVTKVVEVATAMADGDLSKEIEIYQEDEIGSLANAFRNINGRIRNILEEINRLLQAVQDGRLDTRGNAEAFNGDWQELVVGVNNLIDAFVTPINVTAEYVDRISRGDIPEKISTEYKGDFSEIKQNLNGLIETITQLVEEMDRLTRSAVEGQLDTRGNAGTFQGDFARIVQGANNTLDAVVDPLNVAARYVDRISQGDIPDKITEEYQGDFNAIKQNLNRLIDGMNDVTQLAEAMAAGNLSVEVKERSARDTLMQALNAMIQRLNGVVMDVKAAAGNVAFGSQAMSTSLEDLSQGATEQATAAEQVSSAMEEMTANIRQNADNALKTEKIALKSAENIREGGQAVANTVTAMHDI
ncbi:MAG: HAMP domain-containing protein, partial [bacterium]|nr:HAMP domain-containing protein [bacterium]